MPLGSPAEEQEPSWEKKVLFGGCTGDVFSPPLSSIFPAFSSPFCEDSCQNAGTAGRRSQSDEGEPGGGQLFFREESSLHLVDFEPFGEFTHLGVGFSFFLFF